MTTPLLWHHGEDMYTPKKTLSHQAFFYGAEDNRQGVLAVELVHPGSTTASANPSTVQLNWSFA